jgi:protein-disulfide isomerase
VTVSGESEKPPAGEQHDERRSRQRWRTLTTFLVGMIVGAAGFAAYTLAVPDSNTTAVRGAARSGTLDAIAALQRQQAQAAGATQAAPQRSASSFTVRDADRIGDKKAPVTIVEFADFQCPYCRRFFESTEPGLLKEYVDTDKVTFVFKNYPFLGVESVWAAEAAECAANQAKFWRYHDLLFNRQGNENGGAFTKAKLEGFARELGLDMSRFRPCLEKGRTLGRVQADRQEGTQAGVNGTPTLFVNGQSMVGATSLAKLQSAIKQILSAG